MATAESHQRALDRYRQMATAVLSDEQRVDLRAWEREHVSGDGAIGTSDWPGWAELLKAPAAAGTKGTVSDVGRYGIVPEWVLRATPNPRAIHLFAIFACLHADRETGESYPSRRTLAAEMGVTIRTVDAAVDELKRIGALAVETRYAAEGDRTSSLYLLHYAAQAVAQETAPPHAVDYTENQNQEPESVVTTPSLPETSWPEFIDVLRSIPRWDSDEAKDLRLIVWAREKFDKVKFGDPAKRAGFAVQQALALKDWWGDGTRKETKGKLPRARYQNWFNRDLSEARDGRPNRSSGPEAPQRRMAGPDRPHERRPARSRATGGARRF